MECASQVNMAVTLPKEDCIGLTSTGFVDIKDHELFAMSKKTINSLMSIGADRNITTAEPVILDGKSGSRFTGKEVLSHIESNIFRF